MEAFGVSQGLLVALSLVSDGDCKGRERKRTDVWLVFTASRFQGATVTDLAAAMGISRKNIAPSGCSNVFSVCCSVV
jgi:hypothetical protein